MEYKPDCARMQDFSCVMYHFLLDTALR
jgi:hypothetical protein